ncbi:MAG: hypothetical protein WC002_02180 [Candidatus Muiribacteriota bacterium]
MLRKVSIIIVILLFFFFSNSCGTQPEQEIKTQNDLHNDKIITYTTNDGLTDNFISALYVENIREREIIWIGTWKGLVKFDDERWVNYTTKDGLAQDHVTDIKIDKENKLWVSSISLKQEGGISVYEGLKWNSFTKINDEDENIGNIICMFVDSSNRLWAGSWGNGIIMFDGTEWHNFKTENGIIANEIMDINEFDGKVWFATKFDGAFYADESGDNIKWIVVNEHSSKLINNSICTFSSDSDEIWIGTWGGVSVFDGETWRNYTSWGNRLADNFVRTMLIDGKKVYFGTDKGLTVLNDKTNNPNEQSNWVTYTTLDGFPSNKILSLAATSRYIWVGTDKGLVKISK